MQKKRPFNSKKEKDTADYHPNKKIKLQLHSEVKTYKTEPTEPTEKPGTDKSSHQKLKKISKQVVLLLTPLYAEKKFASRVCNSFYLLIHVYHRLAVSHHAL